VVAVLIADHLDASIDERRYEFDGNCREGAISHMQIWKRNYYTHTCQPPVATANGLLITDTGLIPYTIPGYDDLTYKYLLTKSDRLNYGRLQPSFLTSVEALTSFQSSAHPELATSYCLQFSNDMLRCDCPLLFRQIRIIKHATTVSRSNITLITIARPSDFHDPRMKDVLAWNGPVIVVLGYYEILYPRGSISKLMNHAQLTIVAVDLSCRYNQSAFSHSGRIKPPLPDNTMYNIGLDLSYTDAILLLPIGFRLDHFHKNYSIPSADIIYEQLVNTGGRGVILLPAYHNDRGSVMEPFPSATRGYSKQQNKKLLVDYAVALESASTGESIAGFHGDESPAVSYLC
jgi:hypothetical protein